MSFWSTHRKPTPSALTAAAPPPSLWTSMAAAILGFDPARPIPDLETTWSNEKIVAYRTVKVVEDDGMWLGHYHPDDPSITTERHGNGEAMTASCYVKCGVSPSMICPSTAGDGCGFYAYKTEEQAWKMDG